MPVKFEGKGKSNIGMKVSLLQYDAAVKFNRDIFGLGRAGDSVGRNGHLQERMHG